MANFLIAYDLKKSGQNYECITEKLTKLGAFHSQQSVWLLNSQSTCATIRDHLKGCLDTNDELIVVKIEDWATYRMPQDAEYLRK